MKRIVAALLGLGLAACQPAEPPAPAPAPEPAPAQTAAPQPGHPALSFVQGACADCHAVEPNWLSPDPQAPTFTSIANRHGLSAQTLSTFLSDAHNYPEAMDFDLTPERVEQLTAYILTLRDENYTPAPD